DPFSDELHVLAVKAKIEAMYADIVGQVTNDVVEQLSFVDRVAFNEITDAWEIVENIGTFTPDFTPTNVNDGLPHQCAPYLIFKTTRPRTVGKKFLFPFAEDQQDHTILAAGAITAMTAFVVEMLAPRAVGGDVTLTMGVIRTGVASWYNFLVGVVSDVIGTQRRRKPGVGA
ncbi:unnamed protein product, partial [marine sediment metagenome]